MHRPGLDVRSQQFDHMHVEKKEKEEEMHHPSLDLRSNDLITCK